MVSHKCKLCSKTFPNGRALGGHMKAHLATFPLPPKLPQYSSSSSDDEYEDDEEEHEHDAPSHRESDEKSLIYALRENPKKSFKLADPEFSFPVHTGSVVQDRESETESKNNPTRPRSNRNPRPIPGPISQPKKPKLSFMESPSRQQQPVSSVSDTSPEEDVAMCLMMLSRDTWKKNKMNNNVNAFEEEEKLVGKSKGLLIEEIKFRRVRGKHKCDKCAKTFRSSRALGSHRSVCVRVQVSGNDKIFQCPFCSKVFGSGQALGGHKRSHLIPSSSSTANNGDSTKLRQSFLDLNLPAPPEEDDLSVVSDA
ncbi:hypothetical protein RJT34_05483 [Clitoria ternatea]|uniref:C2H2-type domain-containing protein n=1 Tax=Clitoria ternatea TaxID=43366 RepID=A0AAN9K0P5_CLITE